MGKNRPESKCEYLCEQLSTGAGYKQHKWIEVQVKTPAEAEKYETEIKTQDSQTSSLIRRFNVHKALSMVVKDYQKTENRKWFLNLKAEAEAANHYLRTRSSDNNKIREQRKREAQERERKEQEKEQERKEREWPMDQLNILDPEHKMSPTHRSMFLEAQFRIHAENQAKKKAEKEAERKAEIAKQHAREIERQRVQRRQEFWRKSKKLIIFVICLIVASVIIFIKFNLEGVNIDIAKGISFKDKTVATLAYGADIVKVFKHAVFECRDYKKISGDVFTVNDINEKGLNVTYANHQVTLPYDARKPLSKNTMYVWSADDSKGFYLKPTMAGYKVYTYKTPKEMVNGKMKLYSTYACGSFINNTRYPFLHKERVSKTFTDLFDTADLKLVRNSIFASHGYVFKSDDVTNYFKRYPWYHPGNNSLDNYTQIEKDNAKFIKKIEDGRNKK